jgi:hypothetical protein
MCQFSFRLRCRSLSSILHFDRTVTSSFDVRMRSTGEWGASAEQEPSLHLTQIPYDTSRRECEASRKFSALLHFVDGAVREWDHFVELMSSDCSS